MEYNNFRHAGRTDVARWYISAIDIDDRRQAEEGFRQEDTALREEIDEPSMFEVTVGTFSASGIVSVDRRGTLKLGTIIVELSQYVLEALHRDEEFVLYRGEHSNQPGSPSVLLLAPASTQPALTTLKKIEHEYSLRDELDSAWAVRSLAVSEQRGLTMLVPEDPGDETLDRFLPGPMGIKQFLQLAVSAAKALGGLHKRELIHKDVKPTNVLVNPETCQVRLMGFGITSRLPRERQAPELPEFIAGTLHYMAPEQTGRMNRSIDSRSDLYSLGVTLYEMLTGTLPFTASDPMELVHCHIARQPTPPQMKLKGIPDTVSAIVMKLLAKTAEERYQSAIGAA